MHVKSHYITPSHVLEEHPPCSGGGSSIGGVPSCMRRFVCNEKTEDAANHVRKLVPGGSTSKVLPYDRWSCYISMYIDSQPRLGYIMAHIKSASHARPPAKNFKLSDKH